MIENNDGNEKIRPLDKEKILADLRAEKGAAEPGGARGKRAASARPEKSKQRAGKGDDGGRPGGCETILLRGEMQERIDAVTGWLREHNEPPHLFKRGRDLVRIVRDRGRSQPGTIEGRAALQAHLAHYVTFEKLKPKEDGFETIPCKQMPRDVAEAFLVQPDWPVPDLEGVYRGPVYGSSARNGWRLRTENGYHESAKVWIDIGDMGDIDAPTNPTRADVDDARRLILDDLLIDFPFADGASKTNAVALGLTFFVRPALDGRTPLHLVTAPVHGTGKTLLVNALSLIAEGQAAAAMSEARNDDEWRKRITATLAQSPSAILIDNVRRKLDSGALASALTAEFITDRWLGESRMVSLRNDAVWAATANNPAISGEMSRRSVLIRLRPDEERPWMRDEFKHDPLAPWVEENRRRLVRAFLVLVENWLARGGEPGDYTLGSFEQWAANVGGILDAAGFDGFLGNSDALWAEGEREAREWKRLVEVWEDTYGEIPINSGEVLEMVRAEDILAAVVGDKGERSQKTKLGIALGKQAGRTYGDRRIVKAVDAHSKVNAYKLEGV